MKHQLLIYLSLFLFVACIKDAPQNPEADIEAFVVEDSLLTSGVVIDQANKKIFLYLTPSAYESGIAPSLRLSMGATSDPASGELIQFDTPVKYIITSESGANQKIYEVEVVEIGNWTFNFENWGAHPDDKYEFPLEDDGVQVWSSGNPGVALAGVDKRANAYPGRSTTDGYMGSRAVEIVTIPGTFLSEFLGIKLFAGSLFLGDFNSDVAFANPLAATEFGQPYFDRPAFFTGYFKYTPGTSFQDKDGNIVSSEKDKLSLYAVLYNGPTRLNATNINTSDQVVARATVPNDIAPAEFARFQTPFEYIPGRTLGSNPMVAIIASSSYKGDQYMGAIGSRLVIDSLRIIPQ